MFVHFYLATIVYQLYNVLYFVIIKKNTKKTLKILTVHHALI